MKKHASAPVGKEKIIPIITLYVISGGIILIGAAFSVFSLINNISLPVLTSQVPGAVFGAVMIFLGIRYLLSVKKLKDEVFKSASAFSWGNFKKAEKPKS